MLGKRVPLYIFLALLLSVPALAVFKIPEAKSPDPYFHSISQDLLAEQRKELSQAIRSAKKLKAKKLTRDQAVSEILQARNEQLLQSLLKDRPHRSVPGKVRWLTESQATEVYNSIEAHPIVNDKNTRSYDTPMQQIGFCFGRAAYVHWELLRRGVDPQSILKVFAAGNLSHEGRFWEFHVATMVRGAEGGWWVIDRLQPKVMGLENWMKDVKKWSADPERSQLRFYPAHPVKFRPIPGAYSEDALFVSFYKGYFKNLLEWFSSQPNPAKDLFSERPAPPLAAH